MPVLLGLIAAAIGWALWTKKIRPAQILPVILIIAGAGIAAKGQFLGGIGVLVIGFAWFAGVRQPANPEQSRQYVIDKARRLLGVSEKDDEEAMRLRHRKLMAENHPDVGGNTQRAVMLNEARDLLLEELKKAKP